MKKIKRTTIRIRQSELVIANRLENIQAEKITVCPFCHSLLIEQKRLTGEIESAATLLENNISSDKTIL